MVTKERLPAWLLMGLLVACGQSADPCPTGYRGSRSQDRCLAPPTEDAASNVEPVELDPTEIDPTEVEELDAPQADTGQLTARSDASVADAASRASDATASDATVSDVTASARDADMVPADAGAADVADMDATLAPPDAAELEAAVDGSVEETGPDADTNDAGLDAGMDGSALPDSSVAACSVQDVEIWRSGHLADAGLRDHINGCRTTCEGGVDCADQCLRQISGIEACNDCTHAYTQCGGHFCTYSCLPSRTDRICLACLCRADCVRAFDSCSGGALDLCPASLFETTAGASKPPLSVPAILAGSTVTGRLIASRLDESSGKLGPDTGVTQMPTGGPMRFVSLSLDDQEIALHYSANCSVPPCTTRGYLLLEDGTFGPSVYEELWEPDFVDLETFSLDGVRYLLRTRDASAADNILIDRFDWNGPAQSLTRAPMLRTSLLSATQRRYTRAEPFAIDNDVYLYLHAPETGEARFYRVVSSATDVALSPASPGLFLSRGWDLVEAIKSHGEWFLFSFKTGAVETSDEPAGQARIVKPTRDAQGKISMGAPVNDGFWGPGLTDVLTFTDQAGAAHLLINAPVALAPNKPFLDIYSLTADPAEWSEDLRFAVQSQNRALDVFDVVRQGKW